MGTRVGSCLWADVGTGWWGNGAAVPGPGVEAFPAAREELPLLLTWWGAGRSRDFCDLSGQGWPGLPPPPPSRVWGENFILPGAIPARVASWGEEGQVTLGLRDRSTPPPLVGFPLLRFLGVFVGPCGPRQGVVGSLAC